MVFMVAKFGCYMRIARLHVGTNGFIQSIALYCNVCKRVYLNVDAFCRFFLSLALFSSILHQFCCCCCCLPTFDSFFLSLSTAMNFGCTLSTEDFPGTSLFNKITILKNVCTVKRKRERASLDGFLIINKLCCVAYHQSRAKRIHTAKRQKTSNH